MKVVIFSDVHGNLPAFEDMIKDAGSCDQYICLGDLVNYAPWSNECVDLAKSLSNCELLTGNHEDAFLEGSYPGDNELVKAFFNMCVPNFSRFQEIGGFKQSYLAYTYLFQHTINNSYIYPDTKIVLDRNCVIGHSHHQFVYKNNDYTLYNAGSVGQNRKYINVINYLILETETMDFTPRSLKYDVDKIITKMKEMNYPQECLDYYLSKERL